MLKHLVFVIIISISLVLLLSACAPPSGIMGNTLVGSGKFATRDYALDGFTGIQADGGLLVTVTGGTAYGVSVTADDNILNSVIVRKQGTDLVLSLANGSYKTNKLEVAVTLPELTSVKLNGGSRLRTTGPAPQAVNLRIDANGGSNVDVRGIAADKVSVTLNGGSQAWVNAKTSLDYDLNGGSQLRYTGNPTIGGSKAEGGSQVTRF